MNTVLTKQLLVYLLSLAAISCGQKNRVPSKELISAISLKTGNLISCGPQEQQLGTVTFPVSGTAETRKAFNLGVKLLHSFEYDEAEKVFAKIIEAEPGCAMAYWGVAMSNFHPLWTPPSEAELKKGNAAIDIAGSITQKTKRESDYIQAIAAFYKDWEQLDHRSRCLAFEKEMEALYQKYRDDKEAAVFYALALNAAADPSDKSFQKQKRAGTILNSLYPGEPNHPGIVHYIIHTFDYPELSHLALPAARKYASVAPSSAHALHMPSHIFISRGLWDESIQSNISSISAAKCYAEEAGIKGHWDEELHGMDYLVYAYLQKGQNADAKKYCDYLKTITEIQPANFKVAYAFASIPSRYVLENRLWPEAAQLGSPAANFSWDDFPWQKSIIHFTRLLGAVHTGKKAWARAELDTLKKLHDRLAAEKDAYQANQVAIQIKTGEAWMEFKEGKNEKALSLMTLAADMEDKTAKHPVTAGEVRPARELLGDMLLQMNKPAEALEAYEADLEKHPHRFNGLHGAAQAAEKSGFADKSLNYYRQLIANAGPSADRPELMRIKQWLQ